MVKQCPVCGRMVPVLLERVEHGGCVTVESRFGVHDDVDGNVTCYYSSTVFHREAFYGSA